MTEDETVKWLVQALRNKRYKVAAALAASLKQHETSSAYPPCKNTLAYTMQGKPLPPTRHELLIRRIEQDSRENW